MKRGSASLVAIVTAILVSFGSGCERSPDDVENWRNAKNGMEKLQNWATSTSEPMDVRVRALQVIIEENNPTLISSTLDKVKDKKGKKKLVQGGIDKTLELWNKGEPPTISEEAKKKGGRVKLEPGAPTTVAKDAAYYLIPYAEGKNKQKLQNILATWLESDWKLRNKAGKTTLGQLLPRAGDKGVQNALTWLKNTDDPADVAAQLRKKSDENIEKEVAKILKKRAEEAHPDLSDSLRVAVVRTEHELIVPYLKKAITDPKSSPATIDQCMEALKNIQGERSTAFFSKLIKNHPGSLRWAAVNDLIKIRGKAGILTAASSLPLDKAQYEKQAESGKSFRENANWFAKFVIGEMISAGVSTISETLVRALKSERWPVQVLGLVTTGSAVTCATVAKECGETEKARSQTQDLIGEGWSDVKKAVQNLTSSRESIPAWGDEEKRMGELAHDIANAMEKKNDKK